MVKLSVSFFEAYLPPLAPYPLPQEVLPICVKATDVLPPPRSSWSLLLQASLQMGGAVAFSGTCW